MPEVIVSDAVALAGVVRAAEKLREVLDEYGVTLGVTAEPLPGETARVAVAVANEDVGNPSAPYVTVEATPRIVWNVDA